MSYDTLNGSSFSGKPGYGLYLYARRHQTDNANNRSSYVWEEYAQHNSGSNLSYALDPITFGAHLGGVDFYPSHNLDFRGGVVKISLGSGTTGWYGHDGNGYLTLATRAWVNNVPVFGSADSGYGSFYTDRIPKPPSPPGKPWFSNIDTTSVQVSWSGSATDNGAAIDSYLIRQHTNPNPDAAGYVDYVEQYGPRLVSGLTPGMTYYFKVYAHNALGFSAGSDVASVTMKSGAYVGAGGSYPAGSVVVGVNGYFQTAQMFYCATSSGPFVEAK